MRRFIVAAIITAVLAFVGCGGGSKATSSFTPTPSFTTTAEMRDKLAARGLGCTSYAESEPGEDASARAVCEIDLSAMIDDDLEAPIPSNSDPLAPYVPPGVRTGVQVNLMIFTDENTLRANVRVTPAGCRAARALGITHRAWVEGKYWAITVTGPDEDDVIARSIAYQLGSEVNSQRC